MGNNFYQMNNEMLKLNPYNKKDLEYIQFNNYICRKENLQRCKNELDRGLFKLSYTTIIEDTGLSRNKVQRIMKWFEDNGIIECIEKSSKKGMYSVYAYTSVYYSEEEKSNTNSNTNFNTDLSSNSNTLIYMSNTNFSTNNSTSKKEKEKEKLKSDVQTHSSLASTKKSLENQSISGKTQVRCRYKGLEVNANRFNSISSKYRNDKNLYIEHNNYIYEIFESEVLRVNNYWRNNQSVEIINNFDNEENTNQAKLPFKELEEIKKATTGKVEAKNDYYSQYTKGVKMV